MGSHREIENLLKIDDISQNGADEYGIQEYHNKFEEEIVGSLESQHHSLKEFFFPSWL